MVQKTWRVSLLITVRKFWWEIVVLRLKVLIQNMQSVAIKCHYYISAFGRTTLESSKWELSSRVRLKGYKKPGGLPHAPPFEYVLMVNSHTVVESSSSTVVKTKRVRKTWWITPRTSVWKLNSRATVESSKSELLTVVRLFPVRTSK